VVEFGVIFKNLALCSNQRHQVLGATKFWLVACSQYGTCFISLFWYL